MIYFAELPLLLAVLFCLLHRFTGKAKYLGAAKLFHVIAVILLALFLAF